MSDRTRTASCTQGALSLAVITLLTIGFLASAPPASAAEVTVAVVRDGPGPEDQLVGLIEEELANHTPRGTTVRFKADPAFDAGWSYDNAAGALQAAFNDDEVDLVLAVGSLVTYAAARSKEPLAKPVVSSFVQRADVFNLPYSEDGESLKENLSFVVIPQRVGADVKTFRGLLPFDALHVAVTSEDVHVLEELTEGLKRYERDLGIEIVLVPITTDISESIARFSNAAAVYLTRLQRLTTDQRRDLIGRLNEAGVPTFSMLGHPDVELGALAGVTPDIEAQVVRRVALNFGRLMRGKSTADLSVLLSVDTRLRINARTAAAIGYSPGREARVYAEFLHPEELESDAEPLSFSNLFAMAESGSRALQVADSAVEGIRHDQYRARSGLLPQLSADLSYTRADTDLTDSEEGAFGSLVLRQQIYDDSVWSAYRSSTRIFEGAELSREGERLDVLSASGQAFYDLALAQALYRIVVGDLRLTEDNLEMARLREDVGYSGREEVLRWESVLAERRTSLFRAAEDVEAARIALNQVLGEEQGRNWTPEPPVIDPDVFPALEGRLDGLFDDYTSLQPVRGVIVEIALENAPELRSLDKSQEALQIDADQLRRRYFVPRIFADASYSEQFTTPGGSIFPEDESYSITLNAAYPLFEGGRRRHDLRRARSDQETLSRQHRLVAELIEQRTRTALQRCDNSFPRIKFGIQASEAAGESLELVREQYSQGTVNVTDLLDAQNQKLASDQFAKSAIYEFMGDLIELQRAVAWFELDHTPEQQDAFVERILSAIAEE